MFIADQFVYVELPKTATTTVNSWLHQTVKGETRGKHNRPGPLLLQSDRKIIATVRNPWEWYLSLWSFGCKRKEKSGSYNHLTKWKPLSLKHGFRINPWAAAFGYITRLTRGVFTNFKSNKRLYADAEDPALFRAWIKILLNKKNAWMLSSQYNYSSISNYASHLSWAYCKLYCTDIRDLATKKLKSLEELKAWEQEHCYIDHFMRVGQLSEDFLSIMEQMYVPIDLDHFHKHVKGIKVNVSRKNRRIDDFYDEETKALVNEKEQLLIQKFGFIYPGNGS